MRGLPLLETIVVLSTGTPTGNMPRSNGLATRSTKRRPRTRKQTSENQIAGALLQIVRDLALELRPRARGRLVIDFDSDLERDLGFDSLGLAELLLRLDKAFKVRLPDQLITEAATPRDFLQAILKASPKTGRALAKTVATAAALPETSAPDHATNLIDVLKWHSAGHSDRPHLRVWHGPGDEELITYGDLDRAARAIAHGLREKGLNGGERVAIMLPTQIDYFFAFFGVLFAGGVPVPIYPPFRRAQVADHLRRQAGILRNAQASYLITGEEIRNVGVLLYSLVEDLRAITTVRELRESGLMDEARPAAASETALIQYTSGSTGDPKGVVLSHYNLLSNIRAMGEAIEASSADTFVSWLPLYHDMGLIGAWLGSLYYGAQLIIMSPLAFLADPARWLRTIHHHRATLSAAPNFAFELCLKNIQDEDIKGLDLSSLRMVVNGAEPISPSTIARFTKRFLPYAFRPGAFAPVYGLAESAVGLAFPPVGRLPIVDHIDRSSLSRHGIAEPADSESSSALKFVACGRPLPGHQVRIVDDDGHEVPNRYQGRLQFKGPSTTSGYFRDPEKTDALFDGDWLESGDLAYVAEGDIFITGRVKDVIIKGGRNIYPHELEETVGNVEGVRKGCVAVFPGKDERTGTERLIVLAETRLTEPEQHEHLRQAITDASIALLDMPPDDIVIAPPHTVPKTSSGKLRRSAAREIYETGKIGRKQVALWRQLVGLSLAGIPHLARRIIRTTLDHAFAAYWWVLLCTVSVIAWPLVVVLPRRDWRHGALRILARLFFRLTARSFSVEMDEPLPEANAVLVANHSSYVDGAVLMAALPDELTFVAKEELRTQAGAGIFLRRLGTLFVRRADPKGGIEDTGEMLNAALAGQRLVSFPEGTLTRMPGLLSFRLGAFLVAAESSRPVVPITIRGTRTILRGGQWFPRFGDISIEVAKPIAPDGTDFDAAIRLRDAARQEILERCGEPDLGAERVIF
jgi:1-acyl-sn-glycerol-3-phosphate acyltransferase